MGTTECYDITIIGGGTAGLFAAYYAGMRDMKTKIIETHSVLGGTVAVFYPEKNIYDIGGVPKISGQQYANQLIEQAKIFDPAILMNQKVEQLEQQEDGTYILTTHTGEKHYTKTVIIAVGPGAFSINKMKINNEYLEEGGPIHYEPVQPEQFAGEHVMVYGGAQEAVTRANSLSGIAKKVYLLHRHDKFKSLEPDLRKLENSDVESLTPYRIAKLDCDNHSPLTIHARNIKTKEDKAISVDDLIISQGYSFDVSPVTNWGFTMEKRRITVDEKMGAPMKGVFVAGDIAGYPQKWRLIASAFNEAITAVNNAKAYIDPSASAQVYSTVLMNQG